MPVISWLTNTYASCNDCEGSFCRQGLFRKPRYRCRWRLSGGLPPPCQPSRWTDDRRRRPRSSIVAGQWCWYEKKAQFDSVGEEFMTWSGKAQTQRTKIYFWCVTIPYTLCQRLNAGAVLNPMTTTTSAFSFAIPALDSSFRLPDKQQKSPYTIH